MYVRLLTGRDAGEVQDLRWESAQQMIADGRAELPDAPKAIAEPAAKPEVTHPNRRTRRGQPVE